MDCDWIGCATTTFLEELLLIMDCLGNRNG